MQALAIASLGIACLLAFTVLIGTLGARVGARNDGRPFGDVAGPNPYVGMFVLAYRVRRRAVALLVWTVPITVILCIVVANSTS